MKKIFTILFIVFSLVSFAQGLVIEGTCLPVRGTAVKNIWDITPNTLTVPDSGQNKVWDYSGEFLHPSDPF